MHPLSLSYASSLVLCFNAHSLSQRLMGALRCHSAGIALWDESNLSFGAAGVLQDHFRQASFALCDLHMLCNTCTALGVRWNDMHSLVQCESLHQMGMWLRPYHTFLGVWICSVLLQLQTAGECCASCRSFQASGVDVAPICSWPSHLIRAGTICYSLWLQ